MNKIFKRSIALLLSILMITSNLLVYSAFADSSPIPSSEDIYKEWGAPVVQIDNGVLRLTANKQTGRFIVESLSGLPNKKADNYKDLLYGNRFEGPETSYTTVRIDGQDYIYGNDYGFLNIDSHYVTEPYVDTDTNSIISSWSINGVVVVQRLSLINNPKLSSIGSVYVTYDIINSSKSAKNVGVRMLLDTKLADVDSPALTIPGKGFIYKEKEYVGDEIPSLWYAYDQYLTPQIIASGLVSGNGLTKPDKLQFALWGDISQTKWDYTINPNKDIIKITVDGVPYSGEEGQYPETALVDYVAKDSCAVLYWEPVAIEQGETKSINTAYGVGDASAKDNDPGYRISLQGTDKLNMKTDKTGYTIDYVNAEFNIDNNFDISKNINSLQIELELPDELKLIEGEKKLVLKELRAGTYHRSMWKIEPVVQDKFTISAYSILLKAEGLPTQRITKTLIMEGKEATLPNITFLSSSPKTPFYYEDTSRTVFVNGSGFDSFGSAISQVMEAYIQQGDKRYKLDFNTFKKISDTVLSVGIPDNIPLGAYDLFISVAEATNNKNDKKTLKNAVVISDDIKYSSCMVAEITFPIVMQDDGKNTPIEIVKIYGKFIDNKNGTYTSVNATSQNPVRINNTLKFANGTLTINTNPKDAFIEASDGVLWCDIVNEKNRTIAQAIIATKGFRFEETSKIGDDDVFVRMVYEVEGSFSEYDVSYQSVPIELDTVTITKEGIDITGSMGILNPLTYGTNDFMPDTLDLSTISLGFCNAEVDVITIDQEGMDIEGKFAFEMPFVMSLFSGHSAILELNTKQEHIVIEVSVGMGTLIEDSQGLTARIGMRKGRFDEIYVDGDFPVPIQPVPEIPIGISSAAGGLKNLSFVGAFPITVIVGIGVQDTTKIEFLGYNLLSAKGEISVSPFHLEGEVEADLYMMDLAEVYAKFVWATWDPDIEKTGIRIDATLHYRLFEGQIVLQYLDGESFLGRGRLSVVVPGVVPIIGGTKLAGIMAEITQYSVAGAVNILDTDFGIRYYFATDEIEFLELKEELEKSSNSIIQEYDGYCLAQYFYNYTPIQATQYAGESTDYITELNLTNNSNAIIVMRMTEEQFNNLSNASIKIIDPSGKVQTIKAIDNTALFKEDGSIKSKEELADGCDIVAVKQVVNRTAEGLPNEYMVTIPIATPQNGQWTVITKGSMEILPYSAMTSSKIEDLDVSYNNSNNKITANWKLSSDADKFSFYIVKTDEVSAEDINNPAGLWGKGTLLCDKTNPSIEGSYTTEDLNLPTGRYYVYAKTDKENTVSDYELTSIEITNPNTPEAPAGLKIEDIGNNQIKISWDADYNMNQYFVYRKNSTNDVADLSTPISIYSVYDPDDYAPGFVGWPTHLTKERLTRFEVIIDGDPLSSPPKDNTYFFEVRAIGNNVAQASSNSNGTIGSAASGYVKMKAPEEIIVYTEIKSINSKISQAPYVEKDNAGIDHKYYKYVTNTPDIIISAASDKNFKYKIERDNSVLKASEGLVKSYNENITLKDGINYFIITYTNDHGDRLIEEYTVEYDNKAPLLVIVKPVEGAVAKNGKITVEGVTDPYTTVTINNINYDTDTDGKFNVELDFGNSYVSKIYVEARDAAGNLTKQEINILNDYAKVEDITIAPEYKLMGTGSKQQMSTYVSQDEQLGEKLDNSSVKYSIIQGSSYASLSENGELKANYEGTVVVKSEFFVNDTVSLSDSIVIDITGVKQQASKYYPPVYSRNLYLWLTGSSMSTKGGTLKTNGGVMLHIPDGALPYYQDHVDIFACNNTEQIVSNVNLPSDASPVSNAYHIGLTTDLLRPAQLTLPVSGKAYLYYYDESLNALVYLGGEMSEDNKSITANIYRPGTYIAVYNPTQPIFDDLKADYWGYNYIYALSYLGIINGYEDSGKCNYRSEGKITRAEFVKLLVTAQKLNISEAEDLDISFADNKDIPDWALPYIKVAVMNGLINGKKIGGKNYFAAGDYINREEIAAIIGRTLGIEAGEDITFSDYVSISTWAQKEVDKLIRLGIINGYDDNTFRPRNNASRAESASMIYKLLIK